MRKGSVFVVPVDLSPRTAETVSVACALAKHCEAGLHVLRIARPRRASLLGDSPDPRLASPQAERQWSRVQRLIQTAEVDGVQVRTAEYRGDTIDVVASYLQLTKARLLIADQYYGSSRWRRSTTMAGNLARAVSAPVLVVPSFRGSTGARPVAFGHVVSAVDFTVASAIAVRTVFDLLRNSVTRLTVVHALRNSPDRMVFSSGDAIAAARSLPHQMAHVADRIRQKIPARRGVRVDMRVTTGKPDRALLEIASEVDADLIVMGVPPRSRLDEVVFGSTVRGVLRRTKRPVLLLPVAAGAYDWLEDAGA